MLITRARAEEHVRTVTAPDGYALTYRVWQPASPPIATLVLFHGMISHSRWFAPLIDPLVAAGIKVVGADRRGSGLNRVARGHAPSSHSLIEDASTIIQVEVEAGAPLVLAGWCWGTALAANVGLQLGDRVQGVVLAAPGIFPSDAVKEKSLQNDALAGDRDDEATIPPPITDEMFTSGPYLDGFIRIDPDRVECVTPRFKSIAGKLAVAAAGRLRRLSAPLLVILADGDLTTNNDDVRRALGKLPPEKLEVVELQSGHAMQFDAPDRFAAELIRFVRQVMV